MFRLFLITLTIAVFRKAFQMRKSASVTLTKKLALAVLTAALLLIPLTYLMMSFAVQPSFKQLEQVAVAQQEQRVQNGIEDFGKEVVRATRDYAVWDASYNYMLNPTPEFEAETLSPLAQQNLDVEFFGYIRFDGDVVRGEAIDLETAARLPDETKALRAAVTQPHFLARARAENVSNSFVSTSRGIYAFATGWIKKSDGSGAPSGFVVMGRRMESDDLSAVLRVPVSISANMQSDLTPELVKRLEQEPHRQTQYREVDVVSHVGLIGPDKRLLGFVEFKTDRNISRLAARTINLASFALACVIGLVLLILTIVVRKVAIRRLTTLAAHMEWVGESGTIRPSQLGNGSDEIASLARSFDTMSEQLRVAREQLREQSYSQGQTDWAAGILHNLRNALGPVRALQQKWHAEDTAAWRGNLGIAVRELVQKNVDDVRKANLEKFVISAAGKCVRETETRLTEYAEARASLEQAVQILASQDAVANRKSEVETVDVLEVLEQSSSIARRYGGGEIRVTLPQQSCSIAANRLQLVQILGNLFANAAEALYNIDIQHREVRVSVVEQASIGQVEIKIIDNGEGVPRDVLPRIFERGFSTRLGKAGGLGLHWCANSAAAMGGSLRLDSEGPGKGASAILTMPIAAEASDLEARGQYVNKPALSEKRMLKV